MRVPRNKEDATFLDRPVIHGDIVFAAKTPILRGRGGSEFCNVLDGAPDVAHEWATNIDQSIAERGSLMAVNQEHRAKNIVAIRDVEFNALMNDDISEECSQMFLYRRRILPVVIVIPVEAHVAISVMEEFFSEKNIRVGTYDLVG